MCSSQVTKTLGNDAGEEWSWHNQIVWLPKRRISLVCPATGSIDMVILHQTSFSFPASCVHYSGNHVAKIKKKQLWFWQVLTVPLILCLMCHWQIFFLNRLGRGKALWTSFHCDTNPLTMILQSGIKLTKNSCNYPCVPSIFFLVFNKILQKTNILLKSNYPLYILTLPNN